MEGGGQEGGGRVGAAVQENGREVGGGRREREREREAHQSGCMPLHAHADDLLAAVVGQHRRRKDALSPPPARAYCNHQASANAIYPRSLKLLATPPISWPLFVFIVCQQLSLLPPPLNPLPHTSSHS